MKTKYSVNEEIIREMISDMPENKKELLGKALDRNLHLTSVRVMSFGKLRIYKEGFYLILEGTRCKFSVYARDNDGDLVFTRKPSEDKIHLLYTDNVRFSETDFEAIA